MPVILLTNHYDEAPWAIAEAAVPEGFTLRMLPEATREAFLSMAGEADYFLASGRLKIDREILKTAKNLKMIARTGVGTDTLELPALKEAQVPVYVNPGVNAVSVAEHTLMLVLSTLQRTAYVDRRMRQGIWQKQATGLGNHELHHKCVGMIGMGHIGQLTAKLLKPFDVELLYHSRSRKPETVEKESGILWTELPEMLKRVDILILQCALNKETRHLIGEKELAVMKPGSILINTARGGLVDEAALTEALKRGPLAGAGLDVFEKEPPDADNPLFQLENVVLSPHTGGITAEAFGRMMQEAMRNIQIFDTGVLEALAEKRLV